MKITILTTFPGYFSGPMTESIIKRAQDQGLHGEKTPLTLQIINLREYTTDSHHTTDDRPYGGGAGMVMKVEPIYRALEQNNFLEKKDGRKVVLTSAKGRLFTQQVAQEYSQLDELVILCGHYEGVDQRVADHLVDEEVRIGDYVLTGGEPAAVAMVDAVTRLLPGVLGNEDSSVYESHHEPGYLEHPQYTRPEEFMGWKVPSILLQGDHKKIEEWKKENSSLITPEQNEK